TAWAETISLGPTATPPTPSSPPPATTSDASSNGWLSCCRLSLPPSPLRPIRNRLSPPHNGVLHSQLSRLDETATRLSTTPVICYCRLLWRARKPIDPLKWSPTSTILAASRLD